MFDKGNFYPVNIFKVMVNVIKIKIRCGLKKEWLLYYQISPVVTSYFVTQTNTQPFFKDKERKLTYTFDLFPMIFLTQQTFR